MVASTLGLFTDCVIEPISYGCLHIIILLSVLVKEMKDEIIKERLNMYCTRAMLITV